MRKKRKTNESFAIEANKKHNNFYDYSIIDYQGIFSIIKIICPIHGVFEQVAHDHLRGCGCQECGKIKNFINAKDNNEKFLKKAYKKHKNFYSYPDLNYVDSHTNIIIECPIHGPFPQTPNSHLMGSGCKKCANEKLRNERRGTNEEFLEAAYKKHGNKFKYLDLNYIDSYTEISIICPIHGERKQTPTKHLNSCGCRDCGIERSRKAKLITKDDFTRRANSVHNNKYIYPFDDYINNSTDIKIICPIHDEFKQSPQNHLVGRGCPDCGNIKKGESQRLSKKEFEERGHRIHNNFYDYSKFIIKNERTNGIIICPLHGDFPQTFTTHLRGSGCPTCGREKQIKTIIEKYGEAYFKFIPRYNLNSIYYLDQISEKLDVKVQHALNDGEKKFHRYWIDGYIFEYNICIEWDEKGHNRKKQKEKDIIRENYIRENFGCKFVRINEKEFLKDVDNQIDIVVDKINNIIDEINLGKLK